MEGKKRENDVNSPPTLKDEQDGQQHLLTTKVLHNYNPKSTPSRGRRRKRKEEEDDISPKQKAEPINKCRRKRREGPSKEAGNKAGCTSIRRFLQGVS